MEMAMSGTSVTVSELPTCDICDEDGVKDVPAQYDGRTAWGPWANMCERHFFLLGAGLGLGVGQRLILDAS